MIAGMGDEARWGEYIEQFNRNQLAEANRGLAGGGGGSGMSGGFLVDPDRVDMAIRQLTDVIFRVEDRLVDDLTFPAPGQDEVSLNLRDNGIELARRAETFVRTWLMQLQEARAALQAELDAYRRVENENAVQL